MNVVFASDLVVLPYLEISESGVYKYAQTCRIPVLCSDIDEFKESIIEDKNGFMFKRNDYKDLAKSVIEIISSGKLQESGGNIINSKNKNSWADIARNTATLY